MSLSDLLAKDVNEVLEQHSTDGGPALVAQSIANRATGNNFIHLCCIVPSSMSAKILTAVKDAASRVIVAEFGKPMTEDMYINGQLVNKKADC